jgi:hypothetical protein
VTLCSGTFRIDQHLGQNSRASRPKFDEHLGGGVVIEPVAAVSAITIAVCSAAMCRSSNGGLYLE